MKSLNGQINLRVINNTALPQPVSILSIVPNQNTANNNNILYEFNFSGQSFVGVTNVSINISNTSNPTIVVYNVQVLSESIAGVVNALNTLNQGLFSYSGTIIYVSSNYYIYSNIIIAGLSLLGTTGTNPVAIVLDSLGNVYTANNGSSNVSKITPLGVSTIFASVGGFPSSIAIDSSNNLYVNNPFLNNISKITPLGVSTIFASTGTRPIAITVDNVGNIYTANLISKNITKITPLGIATNYGSLNTQNPLALVIDSVGNAFVVCQQNFVIKITPSGVSSNFGTFPVSDFLGDIVIDSLDNIYVSDLTNDTVYKLTPSAVQTVYGTTPLPYSPTKLAIDSLNNIYTLNDYITYKILATGGTVLLQDLSGLGIFSAITVDSSFNVYVTDSTFNKVYLIIQ
jgi:hypothetical protein